MVFCKSGTAVITAGKLHEVSVCIGIIGSVKETQYGITVITSRDFHIVSHCDIEVRDFLREQIVLIFSQIFITFLFAVHSSHNCKVVLVGKCVVIGSIRIHHLSAGDKVVLQETILSVVRII